jgi:hypothetical protein
VLENVADLLVVSNCMLRLAFFPDPGFNCTSQVRVGFPKIALRGFLMNKTSRLYCRKTLLAKISIRVGLKSEKA